MMKSRKMPPPPGSYVATVESVKPDSDGNLDMEVQVQSDPPVKMKHKVRHNVPTLEDIRGVCTIMPKAHAEKHEEWGTAYYGEVWITYGVYENVIVYQDPTLRQREETVDKNLDKWIKSLEGRARIVQELHVLAGE